MLLLYLIAFLPCMFTCFILASTVVFVTGCRLTSTRVIWVAWLAWSLQYFVLFNFTRLSSFIQPFSTLEYSFQACQILALLAPTLDSVEVGHFWTKPHGSNHDQGPLQQQKPPPLRSIHHHIVSWSFTCICSGLWALNWAFLCWFFFLVQFLSRFSGKAKK